MTDWKVASAFPQDNIATSNRVAVFDADTCQANGAPSKRIFLRRNSSPGPLMVVTTQTRQGGGGVAVSQALYSDLGADNAVGVLIDYRRAQWWKIVWLDRATRRDTVAAGLAFLAVVAAAALAIAGAWGTGARVPLWLAVVAAGVMVTAALFKLNADVHKAGR